MRSAEEWFYKIAQCDIPDETRAVIRAIQHDTRATQPSAVPEGWVLVPKEPTEAMLKAAEVELTPCYDQEIINSYKAMLSAAPEHEVKP